MMSLITRLQSSILIVLSIAATTGAASAQTVTGPVQIVSVTSTIPSGSTKFTLPKIRDGINSDLAPFNGFQGQNNATGKITFTFDGHYDLTAFYLWNDINVLAEGVEEYNLTFYRGSSIIGKRTKFFANYGQLQAQMVTFPKMHDITSVEMEVVKNHKLTKNSITRVEIREVAFDGTWFCGGNPTSC